MADDEEEAERSLKDTIGSALGSIGSGGGSEEEEASEVEEEFEVEHKPGLSFDRSDFELQLPHNQEEAEERWSEARADLTVTREVLDDLRGENEEEATENLIRTLSDLEGDLIDQVQRMRSDMNGIARNLQEEREFENREEGTIKEWGKRLERVEYYLEFLHGKLPQQLNAVNQEEAKQIFLGAGKYEMNAGNLPNGHQGLEYTELADVSDQMKVDTYYNRGQTYGMAHALEDLKKINRNHLSNLVPSVEEDVESKLETMQRLKRVLREKERVFSELMKVRYNLEAVEERENIAEEIASNLEERELMSDKAKQRVERNVLDTVETEEEETKELAVTSNKLIRQEAWIIESFENVYEALQESFRIEDRIVEAEDTAISLEGARGPESGGLSGLLGGSGSQPGPHEFLQRLASRVEDEPLASKFDQVVEEYRNMVNNIRELRKLEFTDMKNILVAERLIENVLEEYSQAEEIEQKMEELEDREYQNEWEAERKMNDTVRRALNSIHRQLRSEFGDNPVQDIEEAIEELDRSGRTLQRIKREKEDEIKDQEAIENKIGFINRALKEVESELTDTTQFGSPEITVEFEYNGERHEFDDNLNNVLRHLLEELATVDDHIETEVENEEGEEQNYVEAIEEFHDAYEELERMERAWKIISEEREEMKEELEDLPEDLENQGIREFKTELEMIEEGDIIEYIEKFRKGKAREKLEAAENILEDVSEEDKKELELLEKLGEIDQKGGNEVEELINLVKQHSGEMPNSKKTVQLLDEILESIKDIDEKQNVLRQELKKEEKFSDDKIGGDFSVEI